MKENSIVFVQREIEDKLGPMLLTAYLKAHGYKASIVIDPLKHIKVIQEINPTFIGISILSPAINWALKISLALKTYLPNSIIILGGPHPTFFPEVIKQDGVDMVCMGEGEKPLLEIMKSYDGTITSLASIPNCWVKNGSTIKKNEMCSLLSEDELSQLPFSDRSHFPQYPSLRHSPHKKIWTSRGCPYSCSYCFNHKYKKLYKGLGKTVRQRSVDSVINELKELKKHGWNCLEIVDDQFLLSKDWLFEFCEKYSLHISLPFACNSTAKQIKHDVIVALKKAGCKTVCFAIESGNESIRKNVYKKPVTNEDIYNTADVLNSHNMPFLTFNMVGLPEETMEDIYQTIEINQKIKTTYPWCSILQAYPGTSIADYLKEQGVEFGSDFTYSYFTSSTIGGSEKTRTISNAQKLFAHFVKSNAKYKKVRFLIENPPFVLYKCYPSVFYLHYGNDIKKRYGISWFSLFRYWLYSRQN